MKKKKLVAVCLAMTFIFSAFTACKRNDIKEETKETDYIEKANKDQLTLYQDGSILEVSVVDMSGIDDTSDLKEYVEVQVAGFNKAEGVDKASLLQYEENGKLVKTAIKFSSLDAYNDFNKFDFDLQIYKATSTDADAVITATYTDAKTSQTVNSYDVDGEGLMMLTVDKPYIIKIDDGKILYTGKGAKVVVSGGEDAAEVEEGKEGVILFQFK